MCPRLRGEFVFCINHKLGGAGVGVGQARPAVTVIEVDFDATIMCNGVAV